MTALIVDASAILAIFDEAYDEHRPVGAILRAGSYSLVVSPFVVAEADYMLHSRLGAGAARMFTRDVISEAYELAEWAAIDHGAALAVTGQYGGRQGLHWCCGCIQRGPGRPVSDDEPAHPRSAALPSDIPAVGADHFTLLPYDAEP